MIYNKFLPLVLLLNLIACAASNQGTVAPKVFRTTRVNTEELRSVIAVKVLPIKLESGARDLQSQLPALKSKLQDLTSNLISKSESYTHNLSTSITSYSDGSMVESGRTKVTFSMRLEDLTGQLVWEGDFNYTDHAASENWLDYSRRSEMKNQIGWLSASAVLNSGFEKAIQDLSENRQKIYLNQAVN